MKVLLARRLAVAALGTTVLVACRQDMHDQPRFEAFEHNAFYADGRSARPQVEGTLARSQLESDELLYTGKEDGQPAQRFPFSISAADLQRGRQRYDIYCAICHDHTGLGQGMAVRHGMRAPTSLHDERLRSAPPGYFFDVITHGFGAMIDYADRIEPADRWRIVAYIRALQLSQNAPEIELLPETRRLLEEQP